MHIYRVNLILFGFSFQQGLDRSLEAQQYCLTRTNLIIEAKTTAQNFCLTIKARQFKIARSF